MNRAILRILAALAAIAAGAAIFGADAQERSNTGKPPTHTKSGNTRPTASAPQTASVASRVVMPPGAKPSEALASPALGASGASESVPNSAKDAKAAKEDTDATIAHWTVVLGWATGASALVAFLQLMLLIRGAKDTENAAKASQRSANISELALTKLERPYVLVTIKKPGLAYRDLGGQPEVAAGTQEIHLLNFGRSPALLTEFVHDYSPLVERGGTPKLRPLNAINQTLFPYGTFTAKGDPHGERRELGVGNGYAVSLAKGDYEAWVLGYVRYSDLLGNEYMTGFAFKFDPRRDEFVRAGGEEFNYGKQTKEVVVPDPPARAWWKFGRRT